MPKLALRVIINIIVIISDHNYWDGGIISLRLVITFQQNNKVYN